MLVLPESLTLHEAREAVRALALASQQAQDKVVTVDASGLRRFDSSALAVLLECRRMAEAAGKGFAARQLPPRLIELASLYGLDALLLDHTSPRTA